MAIIVKRTSQFSHLRNLGSSQSRQGIKMPNARVSAMPEIPKEGDNHERERYGDEGRSKQKKGITMEDLKHQTAMRLAQEQRRRNQNELEKKRGQDPRAWTVNQTRVHSVSSPSSGVYRRKEQHCLQQHTAPIERVDSDKSSHSYHKSNKIFVDRGSKHSERHRQREPMSPNFHQHHYPQPYYDHNAPVQPSDSFADDSPKSNHDLGVQERFQQMKNRSKSQARKVSCQIYSSSHHKKSPSKSFSHGLTVQELKEMTRARLAAETDGKSLGGQTNSDTQSQQPVHSPWQQNRHRLQSHETFQKDPVRKRLNSSDSLSSTPSTHLQEGSEGPFGNKQIFQQHSFDHNHVTSTPMQGHGWDNYSLHSSSEVGSEYHGSETPLLPSAQDDHPNYSVNRSLSFRTGSDIDDVPEQERVEPTKRGGFASNFFSNRRRAQTMSPPTLSHLLENEAVSSQAMSEDLRVNDEIIKHLRVPTLEKGRSGDPFSHDFTSKSPSNFQMEDLNNPARESPWKNNIFGRPSMDTVPTHSLSSAESNPGTDEGIVLPLNFGPTSGDVPNSVAESVLQTDSSRALNDKFDFDPPLQEYQEWCNKSGFNVKDSFQTPSNSRDDEGSWNNINSTVGTDKDDLDQNSLSQLLNNFQGGLTFTPSSADLSPSPFVSKIDPELSGRVAEDAETWEESEGKGTKQKSEVPSSSSIFSNVRRSSNRKKKNKS